MAVRPKPKANANAKERNRIAVLSDLHGNLPAAEAVFADIRRRGIADILCLGDSVGKGPHSDRVTDLVRSNCRLSVQGNWDDKVADPTKSNPILDWHRAYLGEERIAYLSKLPFSCDLIIEGRWVRLFHASSRSVYHRVHAEDAIKKRLAMFQATKSTGFRGYTRTPDAIGYGDVHETFIHNYKTEEGGKTLFNVGSAGNPLDIPEASYVIIEGRLDAVWVPRGRGNEGAAEKPNPDPTPWQRARRPGTEAGFLNTLEAADRRGSFGIQFVRVSYDIELAVQQAKERGMPYPDPYICELYTAVYRGDQGKKRPI
jgi:protein phosphatase